MPNLSLNEIKRVAKMRRIETTQICLKKGY